MYCQNCGMLKINCICGKYNKSDINRNENHEINEETKTDFSSDTVENESQVNSKQDKIQKTIKENFPFSTFLEDQLEILTEMVDAIEEGYKYIILESGVGKSAIAATLANIYKSSFILSDNEKLQEKYHEEYDLINNDKFYVSNHSDAFNEFEKLDKRKLLIVDDAHKFDENIADFFSCAIHLSDFDDELIDSFYCDVRDIENKEVDVWLDFINHLSLDDEKVIRKPKYNTLIEKIEQVPVEEVHNGYFSVDKKGKVKDSRETKKGKLRANKDDESTFNLIMRDKEKLLSFDSNLKFIFSHSALKEGWDNPNVFQICTLNETSSTMKKRQEIGRGLRLCVNQDGERIKDNNINILTVMANESYSDFAKKLQSEMENDTGIKFGTIEKTSFAHIIMENKKGKKEAIGSQKSLELFNHFKKMKYINGKGKVQDTLKQAIIDNTVEVPEKYESIKEDIVSVAKRQTKHYEIKNANNKRKVKVNKHVFLSDDFKEFWDKIKHKTTYSVEFDTDELIEKCCNALKDELNIKPPKLIYTKSGLTIDASGVNYKEGTVKTVYSDEDEIALPNILKFLQNTTSLTRKTIIKILIESETLDQFKKNPTEYMNESSKIIKRVMSSLIVDGVKYSELDDYYSQQLFENEELWGYLNKNIIESHRSVYDHIVYDSEVEKNFAERLENDDEVELYTKLPGWFKIATPIGGYNPDWAILFNKDGERKMYFVVETKGTKDITQLRPSEQAKIKCGKKHFKALGSDVELEVTNSYEDLKSSI